MGFILASGSEGLMVVMEGSLIEITGRMKHSRLKRDEGSDEERAVGEERAGERWGSRT